MVNLVFGAHLGVPKDWNDRFCCVWFNQEQIGQGGATLPPEYLELLATSHVIDYDPANVASYPKAPVRYSEDGSRLLEVVPLLHAPFLQRSGGGIPLADRPLDLLFFGSMNEERVQLIERIERCGVSVARFDHPMFGPERDEYIGQSKAVLNLPFYGSNRFEQVRVFNALSIGTPVVSLRRPGLVVEPAYENSVQWFGEPDLEPYFKSEFGTHPWLSRSKQQLEHWKTYDPAEQIARLADALKRLHERRVSNAPLRAKVRAVTHLNLQGHRHYRPDWLNASQHLGEADVVLRLAGDELVSASMDLSSQGEIWRLIPGHVEAILAEQDTTERHALRCLTANVALLLRTGGQCILESPLGVFGSNDSNLPMAQERALAQVRTALDEQLCTGVGDGTLQIEAAEDVQEETVTQEGRRHTLRVHLRKRECSPREQVLRRSARLDFGAFPEDTAIDSEFVV